MADTEQTTGELAPGEAVDLVDAGADLIDVRRPYEYQGGRIPGARNVEMNELTAAAESISREQAVVFYCRSGNRSQMASQAFREAGFDAHHLAGGIEAWVGEGRKIEPEDGEIRGPPLPTA